METKLNYREEQIRCYLASTGDAETACQQIRMLYFHSGRTIEQICFDCYVAIHNVFAAAFGLENKAEYYDDFIEDFCKSYNII